MTKSKFIVPRDSRDEVTFAVVHVEIAAKGQKKNMGGIRVFLTALRDAVTQWVKETKEGREAWESSCEDFNIGDLSNEKLDYVNGILTIKYGVKISDIATHSMDCGGRLWSFDEKLVDENSLI